MRLVSLVILSSWLILGGVSGACKGQDQQTAANEQVMKLLRSHESTLGLIHQFDIQFEVWDRNPANTPAVISNTSRWARKDDLERIRVAAFVRRAGSGEVEKVLFGDQFDDGKEIRVLKGWDPEHPVSLEPMYQKGVNAFLERHPIQQQTIQDPAPGFLLRARPEISSNSTTVLRVA